MLRFPRGGFRDIFSRDIFSRDSFNPTEPTSNAIPATRNIVSRKDCSRLPSAVVSNSLALTRISLLYIALLLCFTVPLSRSFYCFQPCPFPARQSLARFSAVFRIPFPLPNILLKTLIHTCRFFAAYTCFSQF